MDCRDVAEQDILERYLLDRLTGPERDEFEGHYFECASCFAGLRTALALQGELQRHPMLAQPRSALLRSAWALTPALVALVLLFVMGIWWHTAKQKTSQQVISSSSASRPMLPEQSQPPLEELARVEPPRYSSVALRGVDDEAHETFHKAMQYYLKGDYTNAIPGLRAAVKASPRTASFNFYLGACYLLTDQNDSAIESFLKTVSLGDPAYSERAHYYLAKAYLRKKDVHAAESELQTTIRLQGTKKIEAEEILRELRK